MDSAPEEQVESGLRSRALAIYLGVGGVALSVFAVYVFARLWPIAILVLISVMLVAALTPIVRRIQEKYNRKTATTVVVVSLLLAVLSAIVVTIPPVAAQLNSLGEDFDRIFKQFQAQLSQSSPQFAKVLGQLKIAALPSQTEPQTVREVIFAAFTLITGFVSVLMLTAYLVIEGPNVATAMVSVFPRENRLQVRQLFSEIGEQVGSYIRGQLTTSFLAGAATFAVLIAFSVPNALALAWLMAILDAIPIVGPILGIVPAVVSAYGNSGETAVYVLIALTIYHQVESYYLVPRIYGKALRLSPLAVLLSILAGATLLGMAGAFLALPFAAVVPIFLRHFNQWRSRDTETPGLPGEVGAT
jgi:predicted PurR-regulated permease PerM